MLAAVKVAGQAQLRCRLRCRWIPGGDRDAHMTNADGRKRATSRAPHRAASTIKQVAERAGVSIATVSRAFADADAVSAAEPRLQSRAPSQLSAKPRCASLAWARQSRRRRHSCLQNPFFTGLVRGIEGVLQSAGYTLLLANADEDHARGTHPCDVPRRRRRRDHLCSINSRNAPRASARPTGPRRGRRSFPLRATSTW